MVDYLGPLGGLVPIPTASEISPSQDSRFVVSRTVEQVARAQMLPRHLPRRWVVSNRAVAPAEFDVIHAFAMGLYGRGPFTYVGADARALSVLTPAQSALRILGTGFDPAGPVTVDGVPLPASASVNFPSSWRGLVDVPVVPGVPVTASVWVQAPTGAPQISTGWWINGAVGAAQTVSGVSGGRWQRLSWSGITPPGATQLRLGVRSIVTAVAGPQVTWTRGPVPYAAGRAAASVIVTEASATPVSLHPGAPYVTADYTLEEVGDAGW